MDKREEILRSALELFANKGYEGTGVQEICVLAGITKPTLYHYFGNKLGLLEELLEDNFNRVNEKIRIASIYEGNLVMSLRKIIAAYFEIANNQTLFYRMQLAMSFGPLESEATPLLVKKVVKQYSYIEEMFKQAVVQHGNMRGKEKIYSATFIGMINTYVSIKLLGHLEFGDELIYRAVHQFMHGILS